MLQQTNHYQTILAQLGIATLVCGAISRLLYEMVMSNGILVIPFVAGDLGGFHAVTRQRRTK